MCIIPLRSLQKKTEPALWVSAGLIKTLKPPALHSLILSPGHPATPAAARLHLRALLLVRPPETALPQRGSGFMLPLLSRPGSGVVITVRPLDHPVLPLSIPISHLVHCTKQLLIYCSLPTLFIVCLHLSECKLCEHTDFCLFSSLSPAANGSQHIVGTRINICIGTWESFKALSLATSQLWPSQSPPSYGCKASQSPCVLTAAPAQVSPPSP